MMRENKQKADVEDIKKKKTAKTMKQLSLRYLHHEAFLIMLYDVVAMCGGYFLALWLRFDCKYTEIPMEYLSSWLRFAPIYCVIGVGTFFLLHLYQSIWKFASYVELKLVTISSALLAVIHCVLITALFQRMPISYYVVGAAIQYMLVLIVRFAYRFVLQERGKRHSAKCKNGAKRIMLIGGGSAGQMLIRDLNNATQVNEIVCCIIDDDPSKWGCYIEGVPIVGGREEILLNVDTYRIDKIYLTIPSATAEQRRDILTICKETNCELKNLPRPYLMMENQITVGDMKDVELEDLLGREPVQVDMDEIGNFIAGKTVVVTGGGGSIGSELCRQIAQHKPRKLIVFDIYENNAYAIGAELRERYPELDLKVLIGSVRDSRRINHIFATYKPDVVYHAAAHKHVPLMEDSPCEAIKNNVVGTYKTAYAAMMSGCQRFVLISTDKAVNPTSVMGASKRLCEMIIQTFNQKVQAGLTDELKPLYTHGGDEGDQLWHHCNTEEPKTEFVAVRFGNVLGSNGSVVPRFKEQIAKGGPVTVTHPDVIRYFMTIPEATSLVLQAGIYAEGGEIFVLDMGSPVKIDSMARNLIRLSGLQPDVDIKIVYTGLRPGEKLYEEKLMSEEGMKTTPNRLIHVGKPIPFDEENFLKQIRELMLAAYAGNEQQIREMVMRIVSSYHPAGKHGSEEKGAAFQAQMEQIEKNDVQLALPH